MSSRDKILSTVKGNQPGPRDLPPLPGGRGGLKPGGASGAFGDPGPGDGPGDLVSSFISVLEGIGGTAYIVSGYDRIGVILREQFRDVGRVVTACPELASFAELATRYDDPHTLEDVGLAILPAHFGVAENGACWITEDQMIERALPFITQHLALVIYRRDIVATMHEAYERIGSFEALGSYGFATFIAGPSKTADIEQSLVLGAHGPASLSVFLVDGEISDAGFY